MDNDIRILIGLTDLNVEFDPKAEQHFNETNLSGTATITWNLLLTYAPNCEKCGTPIVHNGTKMVTNKGPRSSFKFQNYRIRKQKFLCKKCGHTSIAHLSDIQLHNHIIDKVKQTAAMELSENVSQKHIALDNNISTQTVMRAAEGLFVYNKTNFHYLPQNIAFDDFKSGKFATSGMSMILIDSVNHLILDVMKDRGAGQLRAYFNQYSPAARAAVKTITVDLFTPYRAMIKDLFPNANIVADRFHVVTQAYREINKVRISVMKQFGSDSKEYRQLKRFWKLLMKHETALGYTTRKNRINFKHAYLTDKEVIDRLLALSDELRDAYAFYQGILYAIENRDEAELKSVLYPTKNDAQYRSLPKAMKKARRTIRKHFDEIINSFIYGFSNGPIEGSNNKIKAIKRTAYGFRSFKNFRLRILISFKNSFYSMNYKQEAADLNNVKSAA